MQTNTGTRDNDDSFIPVLLSILGYRAQRYVWSVMDRLEPGVILERLVSRGELAVQDYIALRYGGEPRRAAAGILDASARRGVAVIHYWNDSYPKMLRHIPCPPVVLYAKGAVIGENAVAVVGTRNADERSRVIARRLAGDLSRYGYTVVSGMALGIDREAHRGGLDGAGGTVGVLANGIDVLYPQGNADLFKSIGMSPRSALVSEYPPGINAGKWTFIRRNRIISGLACGTVVVMAGLKSGALITARYAAEQNREVFACTGYSFSDEFQGCHDLIRNGAVLVSKTEDVLDELSRLRLPAATRPDQERPNGEGDNGGPGQGTGFFELKRPPYDENSIEGRIISLLAGGNIHVDAAIIAVDATAGEVLRALSRLELDGMIVIKGNHIWPL